MNNRASFVLMYCYSCTSVFPYLFLINVKYKLFYFRGVCNRDNWCNFFHLIFIFSPRIVNQVIRIHYLGTINVLKHHILEIMVAKDIKSRITKSL